MSTVSIVIPTYNQARFVVEAVESALAQTYPYKEVIVVDDGSIDDTRQALAKYGDRIQYIYQDNQGPATARNTGAQRASGEFFLFLDGDDRLPAQKLEIQVPLFEDDQGGVVYSGWRYVDQETGQVLTDVRLQRPDDILADFLCRRVYFPPGVAVVRRQCLDQVGLFDKNVDFAADTEMWVRIAAAGYTFRYVDEPLFDYRIVQGSMSRNNQKLSQAEFARLDKLFETPGLPDHILALRNEAYSILHYEYSTRYYHAGDIENAQDHLQQAIKLYPPLANNRDWLLNWLAGYLLGPDVSDANQIIDRVFSNLPSEAVTLSGLERQARGQYHVARIFAGYRNKDTKEIRQHILPAVFQNPAILLNRGFLRIIFEAMIGYPLSV